MKEKLVDIDDMISVLSPSMFCSVSFAEWMKAQYAREVEKPDDNLDMVLRYCDAWNEELYREEYRKANEFYYSLHLKDGRISMTPSYPVTQLFALDPVDFQQTPEYEGFVPKYSVFTTGASFPGCKQHPDYDTRESCSLKGIVSDARYISDRFMEHLNEEQKEQIYKKTACSPLEYCDWLVEPDVFQRVEFYLAMDPDYIDNDPPFSWGPQCPDRILGDDTLRTIIQHMLKDFYRICENEGVSRKHMETFCAALCDAWFSYIYSQDEEQPRRHITCDWQELLEEADRILLRPRLTEEQLEVSDELIYMRMISRFEYILAPEDKERSQYYTDTIGAALANKAEALLGYQSPQEKFANY